MPASGGAIVYMKTNIGTVDLKGKNCSTSRSKLYYHSLENYR
jgi:hypothetical protein